MKTNAFELTSSFVRRYHDWWKWWRGVVFRLCKESFWTKNVTCRKRTTLFSARIWQNMCGHAPWIASLVISPLAKKKMEYLSSEHVHKNFKMNMMFLFLIEVHISSICDSDVLYDVFKFYLTEQAFIWSEQRPKLQKGEWRWSFRDRWRMIER